MLIESFSERLKQAMKIKGLKPVDLSNKLNANRGIISQYLSGRYKPNHWRIEELSKILDVNPVWLMGYDVPMKLSDAQKITPQEFRDEVLSRLDDVTNLTDKQKEMLKMNLDFICGDDNNE